MGTEVKTECIKAKAASTITNPFQPRSDWNLLKQGAEARIWKVPNYSTNSNVDSVQPNTSVICKERFAKKYRHPILDARLTKQRCRMEARLLGKCKEKGINVPAVWQVDSNFSDATSLIYLEFIDGPTVRDYLEDILLPQIEKEGNDTEQFHDTLRRIAVEIGKTISKLHDVGVVHGDLTTSNIMLRNVEAILTQPPHIVLIDFGLAKNTTAIEERAVDLYVLERALQSTHPTLPPSFYASLLSAYVGVPKQNDTNNDVAIKALSSKGFQQDTLTRLEKVRQRGRKRECFG
jgi:TP53 regulating kinase-like protein